MQNVSNRIASFLTDSGNSAKTGGTTSSNTNGQASSFQAQQALPTVSVPTTFTHEAYSGSSSATDAAGTGNIAGRKLKQQQQWVPAPQQQQQVCPSSSS